MRQMHFVVGGRELDLSMERVAHAMQGVQPEPVHKHWVEMHHAAFPPKQVLAAATGWSRDTFTTYEALRVLNRLGFVCRQAGQRPDGRAAWELIGHEPGMEASDDAEVSDDEDDRVAKLESAVEVLQSAVAGLSRRLDDFEQAGRVE
jgi:hypothetical protein